MKHGVTIIICCYNSTKVIRSTLNYLKKQQVPSSILWEVILVDNNCTDDTVNVANDEWSNSNHSIPFRIITETNPGLMNARRTGLFNAKYRYSIFCDDDNRLDPTFVQNAFNIMQENQNIGVLGGLNELAVNNGSETPNWFSEAEGNYAIGKQQSTSGCISDRMFVFGAGMVVQTDVLKEIFNSGVKTLLIGRKGETLSAGDDSEICLWFLIKGYDLWYSEKLTLKHLIDDSRLTIEYYKSLKRGLDESERKLELYKTLIRYKMDMNSMRSFLKAILFLLKKIFIGQLTLIQNLILQYHLHPGFTLDENQFIAISNYKIILKK